MVMCIGVYAYMCVYNKMVRIKRISLSPHTFTSVFHCQGEIICNLLN